MTQQAAQQTKQQVGANLRAARDRAGMTQRQVGDAVGAAGPDVSRWETGRVEPGAYFRQQLADLFFDGDVAELYRTPDEARAAA